MLDDNGIRPPIIAAGINLFGGPLGLLHRHVTGAIPIRRNTKDPALPGDAEGVHRRAAAPTRSALLPRGRAELHGRDEDTQDRPAARDDAGDDSPRQIVPMAMAYDLVLEDRILSRQAAKRRAKAVLARGGRDGALRGGLPVARVRHLRRADPDGRARPRVAPRRPGARARDPARIGRLYKVLPTALVAFAMRSSATRAELEARVDALMRLCAPTGANMGVDSGRQAVEDGDRRRSSHATSSSSTARAAIAYGTARCFAITPGPSNIHSLPRRAPNGRTDAGRRLEIILPRARAQRLAQTPCLPVRHAPARELRPPVHRRRNDRRSPRSRARHPGGRHAHHARPARRERD